jgi:hypothetical protein
MVVAQRMFRGGTSHDPYPVDISSESKSHHPKGRDHRQKGGPRKEMEEAAAGHHLLFLVEPEHVSRERRKT